jgi:hypothetical protein
MVMWFLVVVASLHGVDQPRLSSAMADKHYPTNQACMADAARRIAALASVGVTGRYMCMYHGETDRRMAAAGKRDF